VAFWARSDAVDGVVPRPERSAVPSSAVTEARAATAVVVSFAFSASLWERWLARRRPHEAAWAVALALFCLGALSLWVGASLGWAPWSFRAFYGFGAIVNVPFLAVGTIELLAGRPAARTAWSVATLGGMFALGVVAAAPMHGTIDPNVLPQGSDVFGVLPRVFAAVASGVGASIVFGGAVWSVARRRGNGRLVAGNLVIALGTAILSTSGLLNSVLGEMDAFAVTLAAGVVVLFAGFLVATSPLPARRLRAVDDRAA
jgi:hypothetical protein